MSKKLYCPFCGSAIKRGDRFCFNCGRNLQKITTKTSAHEVTTERPLSLTIASILEAIGGSFSLAMSFILFLILGFLGSIPYPPESTSYILPSASLLVFIAIVLLIWGIVCLIAAYGLWKVKKYGGIIGIIESSIGIVSSIAFLPLLANVISVIVNLIGIIYSFVIIILIVLGWKYLE